MYSIYDVLAHDGTHTDDLDFFDSVALVDDRPVPDDDELPTELLMISRDNPATLIVNGRTLRITTVYMIDDQLYFVVNEKD